MQRGVVFKYEVNLFTIKFWAMFKFLTIGPLRSRSLKGLRQLNICQWEGLVEKGAQV